MSKLSSIEGFWTTQSDGFSCPPFTRPESGIESLEISVKDPDPDSLTVYATGCIDWNRLSVSDGQSCVQDDGEGWEDWENRIDLRKFPIPSPTETAQLAVDQNAFRPAGSTMVFDESSSEEDEAEGSAIVISPIHPRSTATASTKVPPAQDMHDSATLLATITIGAKSNNLALSSKIKDANPDHDSATAAELRFQYTDPEFWKANH
ncbi:MAG: hypothetical protein Q9226_003191 [Calogaya cf. arnoldii]